MKPSPAFDLRGHLRLVHCHPLLLFERGDAWQRAAFHPFEKRSARGRDEGEVLRDAGMVERCDRVAAAGDRDQGAFLGQRRGRLGERDGRRVERRRFERAERPVPDQSPAGLEHVGERLDRGRADVEDHLVGCDLVHVAGPNARRVGRELLRHHHVVGQMDRAAGLLRALEDALGFAGQLMLAQRLADIDPARRKEGVGHAAADDQMIDLADEMAEHRELGRDLGAADDRRHRALRIAKRALQRLELGLHRPPGEARQVMRDALGRRMGAVRGGEGVVDIIVAERRHAPSPARGRSFLRRA